MGKFRSKLKGTSKGKRWAKGQSSSSNPETKKHRDQARSRFFQQNIAGSKLTSDALRSHDAVQSLAPVTKEEKFLQDDDTATGTGTFTTYETMRTFASEWSDCSNVSFKHFMNVFRADSALHKEMLAILAAITEVIKQSGGTETPTEYYCALITTLEQVLSVEDKNEDQITAVLSLIKMGIKTVPQGVLKSSFGDVSKKLLGVLSEYATSENNVIIKSLFGIFSTMLRAQEAAVWTQSTTQQIFATIVNPFCIHTKPKWRKASQSAIAGVVRSPCFSIDSESSGPSTPHTNPMNPAANAVAQFCLQTLEACMGGAQGAVATSALQASKTTILHTLSVLSQNMVEFGKNDIKKCSEAVLRILSLNYPIVGSCCFEVFHTLFSGKKTVIPAKLNGQLIAALYDYQPAMTDRNAVKQWLVVMQQAHIHLTDVDVSVSTTFLPRMFNTSTQLLLADASDVQTAVAHSMDALLRDAIGPACATAQLARKYDSTLAQCFKAVEATLAYQYHQAWPQALHIIKVMFEVGGAHCSHLFSSCLKSLTELRDSYKFSYDRELEVALGAAVKSMGPEAVMNIVSLKDENGDLNIDRSWLILVLRENVRGSTLEFWLRGIFQLAISCQKRAAELSKSNNAIGAHSAELLYMQLWNLLPCFCNFPTDIKANFKSLAKLLGTAIAENKDLRLGVMASLRKLISSAKESENAEDLAEIARFDKNYLPILFNVYTGKPVGTDEVGIRLAALDTIKVYLTVARPELTEHLFETALEQLEQSSEPADSFAKESLLDLIRTLIPYQTTDYIGKLYNQCIKNLAEIKGHKEQKKAYRLLEHICSSETEGCVNFIKNNRKYLTRLLLKTLNTSAVTSKGARMRCVLYLVRNNKDLDKDSKLLQTLLPEAVLCCKDLNTRCRATAFEVINVTGDVLLAHNQIQDFITMLLAGLTGNPHMMSATIMALASVLYNFTASLGKDNIDAILQNITILAKANTREVVGSCLSFIKVFCTRMPSPVVTASIPDIIKTLCGMVDDCKRHFRLKTRNILDRLLRKYGCDIIQVHVPPSDTVMLKRLRNMRKINNRKKRDKEEEENQENEHSDGEDDEFAMKKTKSTSIEEILADSDSDFDDDRNRSTSSNAMKYKKKGSSTWIEEDADTIVDFTDPKARSKITATNPIQNTSQFQAPKKKDRGFKAAPDGRLIIEDLGVDSEEDEPKKKRGNKLEFSDSDDEIASAAETLALTNRKRKRSDRSEAASVGSRKTAQSTTSTSKYQAGGSGIHRKVSKGSASAVGSEYKAKKAFGDVKKKGKVDPYAYLPLKRTALNKRKKMKSAGQFKNIIKAAQAGAQKGRKTKSNLKK